MNLSELTLVLGAHLIGGVQQRAIRHPDLALGLNTLLAAGWAVYSMKKRRCRTIRALGILVLGIYLLVPLLLTDRE